VLRRGQQLLGLAVDAVQGLRRVLSQHIQRLHHTDDAQELFHSAAMLVSEGEALAEPAPVGQAPTALSRTVGVLDVEALMRLAQAWSRADEPEPVVDAAVGLPSPSGETSLPVASLRPLHAVLKVAGRRIAVSTEQLRAIEPMPALQQVFGRHPRLLGVTRWRGHDMAVLHAFAAEQAAPAQGEAPAGCLLAVLESEGSHVGLAVDSAEAVLPLDPAGPVVLPGGENLLRVDAQLLLLEYAMPGEGLDPVGRTALASRQDVGEHLALAQVVVLAGQPWALDIARIEGIRDMPRGLEPVECLHPAFLGHVRWKDAVVPLLDLRLLTGLTATPLEPGLKVVYARRGERVLGLVVERLLMLLPAQSATQTWTREHGGERTRMITTRTAVGAEASARSFAVLPDAVLAAAAAACA
jgi:chemotaxis signal transduction protein